MAINEAQPCKESSLFSFSLSDAVDSLIDCFKSLADSCDFRAQNCRRNVEIDPEVSKRYAAQRRLREFDQ